MFTLIKNINLVSSKEIKLVHILVCNDKVILIRDSFNQELEYFAQSDLCKTHDGSGDYLLPGFIDGHVHVIGASGEGGFHTRAPEISTSVFAKTGVTTVIGMLGADPMSRSIENLVAKTYAINYEGLTAYCLTGSYCFPPASMFEDIKKDIYFLDPVIGVGEVAISDGRSSSPRVEELRRLIKDAHVTIKAKGRKGNVVFHVGDEEAGIEVITEILNKTQIDSKSLVVTHINRNPRLLDQVINLTDLKDTWIDLTAIYFMNKPDSFYHVEDAVEILLDKKPELIDRLTVSSDAGCLIEKNTLTRPDWLKLAFDRLVLEKNMKITDAVKIFMENPAIAWGLDSKGRVQEGADADFFMADKELKIKKVYAKGKLVYDHQVHIETDFYTGKYS